MSQAHLTSSGFLIRSGEKYLLGHSCLKKDDKNIRQFDGNWTIFKGEQDPGEDSLTGIPFSFNFLTSLAAMRELSEESGIHLIADYPTLVPPPDSKPFNTYKTATQKTVLVPSEFPFSKNLMFRSIYWTTQKVCSSIPKPNLFVPPFWWICPRNSPTEKVLQKSINSCGRQKKKQPEWSLNLRNTFSLNNTKRHGQTSRPKWKNCIFVTAENRNGFFLFVLIVLF